MQTERCCQGCRAVVLSVKDEDGPHTFIQELRTVGGLDTSGRGCLAVSFLFFSSHPLDCWRTLPRGPELRTSRTGRRPAVTAAAAAQTVTPPAPVCVSCCLMSWHVMFVSEAERGLLSSLSSELVLPRLLSCCLILALVSLSQAFFITSVCISIPLHASHYCRLNGGRMEVTPVPRRSLCVQVLMLFQNNEFLGSA